MRWKKGELRNDRRKRAAFVSPSYLQIGVQKSQRPDHTKNRKQSVMEPHGEVARMIDKDDALGYGLIGLAILVTGFWTYVLASALIYL